jgi:GntR family transcriptional regulator
MSWSYVVPPSEISNTLDLLESEHCHLAERLDLLDGVPLAYDRVFIPVEFGSSLGEDLLVSVDFLPVWLEREQLDPIHLRQSVEAVLPDEQGQEFLRVSENQPLLLVTEVLQGNRDTPLLAVSTYYRGDRFQLVSTTSGEAITHVTAYGGSN